MDKETLVLGCKQFLLTSKNEVLYSGPSVKIGGFELHYHLDSEYSCCIKNSKQIHLLGEIFDWQFPHWTNREVLEYLIQTSNTEDFLAALSRFMGHYMLLYKSEKDFILLNDACAQYEVYYDSTFSVFGSQVNSMHQVVAEPHSELDTALFFESKAFKSKKVFVGDQTQVSNIRHLRANHLLDINAKCTKRFFPNNELVPLDFSFAVKQAGKILKGYVAAMAHRHQLAIALTAGYDSRVLFLASLQLPSRYFISLHRGMSEKHPDVLIAEKLAVLFSKKLEVIKDVPAKSNDPDFMQYQSTVDFPRKLNRMADECKNHIQLNGNCSEIARSYFGSMPFITGADLAHLIGYSGDRFAIDYCNHWLLSVKAVLQTTHYHPLDLFYWEEKMGNWGAKKRTETNAIGRKIYSPFNSRGLLQVLLSVDRKMRDSHDNQLYKALILHLNQRGLEVPINPFRKHQLIGVMKKLKIYGIYRYTGIKSRLLRF